MGSTASGHRDPNDGFSTRVREHGRFKAILESFAYTRTFGGFFGKTVPLYAESYWYAMGGLTFLSFLFLVFSGIILAFEGPFWWLSTTVGLDAKAFHYWSAQAFFFFAVLHGIRVWATGSYHGRRVINWWIGILIFLLALAENLEGLLARGDWESQFVAMHSNDMLFVQPFFLHLLAPANLTQDLTIHVASSPRCWPH